MNDIHRVIHDTSVSIPIDYPPLSVVGLEGTLTMTDSKKEMYLSLRH